MEVTGGIDVWTPLVDGGMDNEARRVNGLLSTTNSVAVLINMNHIGDG